MLAKQLNILSKTNAKIFAQLIVHFFILVRVKQTTRSGIWGYLSSKKCLSTAKHKYAVQIGKKCCFLHYFILIFQNLTLMSQN